jgi:Spy/CpxP family protein refolding chaperone
MKNFLKMFLGVAVAAALAMPAAAQYGGQMGGQPGGQMGQHRGGMGAHGNVDQRVQMLTKELDLTPDQQAKAKTILEQQQKEMMALKENTSLSEQEREAKLQEIHRSGMEEIRAMLTPDQQKKLQEMRQNMMHHEGGPGGNHPQGAPPNN